MERDGDGVTFPSEAADAVTASLTVAADILACSVTLTVPSETACAAFEAAHCLDPLIQPAFTAPALREFVREMPSAVVHEVIEPLGLSVAIARWDDRLLVIGPYTHEPMFPGAAEELVSRLGIPTAFLSAYKMYRTRYPIVDAEYVHRAAASILRADGSEDRLGTLQRVKAEGGTIAPGQGEKPQSAAFDVIDERYHLEQEFMDAVSEGSAEAALSALQRLGGMPQRISYLNTPFLGATILRIMARVAAQRGGLPPVMIDAISQEYAQRLHRIGHSADARTLDFVGQMVTDFCLQVRRHRQRDYPLIVRQVIDEIDLHPSQHVSTGELAERLEVSVSTLARRFKEATGMTVSEYVSRLRAERAAKLLATTSRSVSDIALFVGYDDANYFVKVFRAAYEMTPTAYRRAHGR